MAGGDVDAVGVVRVESDGLHAEVLELGAAVRHIYLMGLVLRYWSIRDGWHWADDGFISWHMQWFRHWIEHHAT